MRTRKACPSGWARSSWGKRRSGWLHGGRQWLLGNCEPLGPVSLGRGLRAFLEPTVFAGPVSGIWGPMTQSSRGKLEGVSLALKIGQDWCVCVCVAWEVARSRRASEPPPEAGDRAEVGVAPAPWQRQGLVCAQGLSPFCWGSLREVKAKLGDLNSLELP